MNVNSLTFNTDPEGSSLTVCHLKIKYFCCWLLKSIIISQDLAERITQSERMWVFRERVPQCIKWGWFSMCRNKRSAKGGKKTNHHHHHNNKKQTKHSPPQKKNQPNQTKQQNSPQISHQNSPSPKLFFFYNTYKRFLNLYCSCWILGSGVEKEPPHKKLERVCCEACAQVLLKAASSLKDFIFPCDIF